MQYVLTEVEYQSLVARKTERDQKATEELQALCTLAAKHIPVSVSWMRDRDPMPWGCILDDYQATPYCDECPARKVCPYEGKEYSQ